MFANEATKSKLLAFGIVAMFVLCAVSCVADADAAGPYGGLSEDTGSTTKDQKYTLDISTDQEFVYDGITTTLSKVDYGTTSIDWVAPASGNSAVGSITLTDGTNGKKLTGSFTDAGTYSGVLKAVWTANDGNSGTLEQEATQTLVFEVTEKIYIEPTSVTGYGMVGTASGQLLYTIPFKGSNATLTSSYTAGEGTPFSFTIDGQNILVKTNKALDTKGTWKADVTLTNNDTGSSDKVEVIINVYEKVAITNKDTHFYSYEGSTSHGNGFTFIVTGDSGDGLEATDTITFSPTGTTVLTKDTSDRTVKIDTVTGFTAETPGSLIGTGNTSYDYTATLNVSTKTTSDKVVTGESSDSATFTLTVYKSLAFLTSPKIATIDAKSVSTGSNSITLSSYISGAKSVKFDWNDGSTTESVVTGSAANYSVNHTYAKAGTYLITISATNDMGTTTSKVMYAVGQDSSVTPDATTDDTKKDSKGFFDQHGYLFLVFLILAGLFVFVAFYMGYQIPPVLIAIPVCVVLTVLMYFYKDFGGLFDAIKGLR